MNAKAIATYAGFLTAGIAIGAGGYYLATRSDAHNLRERAIAVSDDLRATKGALSIAIGQADRIAEALGDAEQRAESAEARASRLEINNRAIIESVRSAKNDAIGVGGAATDLDSIIRRIQERGPAND